MSRRPKSFDELFANLLCTKWPMAPDPPPETAPSPAPPTPSSEPGKGSPEWLSMVEKRGENFSDLYGNWLYGKMSKTKPTAIRDAEQIDEATKRLASIDRGLASLQCQWRQRRTKDLREQVDAVRRRRDRARIELLEIVELAETPVDLMGWP